MVLVVGEWTDLQQRAPSPEHNTWKLTRAFVA
jgi:hypothetical protein